MKNTFNSTFNGLTVLVTGHTGFKGSWLSIWLEQLGAKVIGYSLEELPTNPSNFALSKVGDKIVDIRGDIRDLDKLKKVLSHYKPELVFHLAAQPILLKSYEDPKTTFDTNAGGTVNILEAVKQTDSVKAVVCITTDKVYKNKEWVWGYREHDELGDTDPYAASKAMAELAIHSYRESFFNNEKHGGRPVKVASTRAGNVVGGGDFADFRLVPDSMKALIAGKPIEIRNPANVRPWQLVLEPLSGYLVLAEKLLNDPFGKHTKGWNFGPKNTKGITAGEIADMVVALWENGSWINTGTANAKKESNLLMLDWSAAHHHLGWHPIYDIKETLSEIVNWHKTYAEQLKKNPDNINMYDICVNQIRKYTEKAKELGLEWANTKKESKTEVEDTTKVKETKSKSTNKPSKKLKK